MAEWLKLTYFVLCTLKHQSINLPQSIKTFNSYPNLGDVLVLEMVRRFSFEAVVGGLERWP